MSEAVVSVIVPIYNVESYLVQCIESITNQSYENLDIILVDDGSTDKSGKICDEYRQKDKRIRVIHKKNGGVSSSRQSGIEAAIGMFCMFVDGDDWLEEQTILRCLEQIQRHNVDCVLFSYMKEYEMNSIPVHILDESCVLIGKQAEQKVYRRLFGLVGEELSHPERGDSIVSCCMKLYRTEFAQKGRYFDTKEVGSSEDALYNMYALHNCTKFAYIDEPLYHYRKNEKSITHTYRPNLRNQWNELFNIMQSIINEKNLGEEYKLALMNRVAISILGIGMNEVSNNENSIYTSIKNIREYLSTSCYRQACIKLKMCELPLFWKVFMTCCRCRMTFFVFIQLEIMKNLKRKM